MLRSGRREASFHSSAFAFRQMGWIWNNKVARVVILPPVCLSVRLCTVTHSDGVMADGIDTRTGNVEF